MQVTNCLVLKWMSRMILFFSNAPIAELKKISTFAAG